jgi:hypothetical protein
LGFRSGAPSLGVVVSNNEKLMGVVLMRDLGAERRRVRIKDVGECRSGRSILLVIETILFRCLLKRERRVGRRGVTMRRRRRGRSGYRWETRCWRLNVVGWGTYPKGLCRRAFLWARVGSIDRVRALCGWGRKKKRRWRPSFEG